MHAVKTFALSERRAISGAFMCTLFHCQGRWFLLGGSDASLGLRQMAHLAPFLIASWPAPVLSGITSHTGSPVTPWYFTPSRAAAVVPAGWPLSRHGGRGAGLEVLRLPGPGWCAATPWRAGRWAHTANQTLLVVVMFQKLLML